MPRTVRTIDGLTEKQERFCQNVAAGMTLANAHVAAGYRADKQGNNSGNASRLASRPEMAARIHVLREDMKLKLVNRAEAFKHATKEEFTKDSEGITLKWLVMELRCNLDGARSEGKYKEANETVKIIAELTGFLKNGNADPDPNRRQGLSSESKPPTAINLSVLNQFTQQLDRDSGKQSTALDAVAVPVIAGPSDIDGDDGAEPAA